MKSVRFSEFGDPAEVLRVEEVERPSAGPGQVLVRMRARPVNPSDLLTVQGLYGSLPQLPATIEVMPCTLDGVASGSQNSCAS